jgi:hypothetical protein
VCVAGVAMRAERPGRMLWGGGSKVARGICPVFSIIQASFHASGRSCLRRAALRAVTRKVIACLGSCFGSTHFVIPCDS